MSFFECGRGRGEAASEKLEVSQVVGCPMQLTWGVVGFCSLVLGGKNIYKSF